MIHHTQELPKVHSRFVKCCSHIDHYQSWTKTCNNSTLVLFQKACIVHFFKYMPCISSHSTIHIYRYPNIALKQWVTVDYFTILRGHTLYLDHRFGGDWSECDSHSYSIDMGYDYWHDKSLLIRAFQKESTCIPFQRTCGGKIVIHQNSKCDKCHLLIL